MSSTLFSDRFRFTTLLLSVAMLLGLQQVSAQSTGGCITIGNMPDTIKACKNTTINLTPTLSSPGLLSLLDTTWTPAAGLSNPNILQPTATIGTTSVQYILSVMALQPFNAVTNGNFSSGNTGFSSGYSLGAGGTWGPVSSEGTYAVTTNPSLAHSNFASFSDHTGNTGGQMMVINGSSTAGTSVWCQTITVDPNSTYDFSAWGATCVNTSPAILQFSINGTALGTPLTLPTTTGQWTNFHATWNSGTATSVTICITNQNTAPSGNDFAIDDIEFRKMCTARDTTYVQVTNLQPLIGHTEFYGCNGDTVNFQANNGLAATPPDTWEWSFGDGSGSTLQNPQHIYLNQGLYTVRLLTRKNGCADSAFTQIDTRNPLAVDFTTNRDSICLGESVQFTNQTSPNSGISFAWNFGDGNTSTLTNPSHTFTAVGAYPVVLVGTNFVPCRDTARDTVYVLAQPPVAITLNDSSICSGEAVRFTATIPITYTSFTWNFGDGTGIDTMKSVQHAYDRPGNFIITMTATHPVCPEVSKDTVVSVAAVPTVALGPDTSICLYGEPVLLTNLTGDLSLKYWWNTGDSSVSIIARHHGLYWLTASNAAGCIGRDSVNVAKDCYIDIPNAFTPNNDGANDYFFPRQLLSKSITKFHLQVFNRWGQVVFATERLEGRGWDGSLNGVQQPEGVYIYLLEVELAGKRAEKYQGNVTLIR